MGPLLTLMGVCVHSLKVFWNNRNKLELSRQTRMFGQLPSEDSHYLPSIPAQTLLLKWKPFFSLMHNIRPSGEASIFHVISPSPTFKTPDPMHLDFRSPAPSLHCCPLVMSLSLSWDLSSSLQTCPPSLLCHHFQRCQYPEPWSLFSLIGVSMPPALVATH